MVNSFIKNKQLKLQEVISLFNDKKVFLLKIFSNLIFQILVTFVIAFNINTNIIDNNVTFILLLLSLFAIIFILSVVKMHPFFKFILFTLFSAITGILLSRVKKYTSKDIIKTSLLGVLGIFISMFLFGVLLVIFGIHLGYKFGLILLYSLLILIICNIVSFFMSKFNIIYKILAVIGLIIFSIYIIYDTNQILQRTNNDDYITASLDYYLDIINIFNNLVSYQSFF
jgi:FtsH-binding integral membrane protein